MTRLEDKYLLKLFNYIKVQSGLLQNTSSLKNNTFLLIVLNELGSRAEKHWIVCFNEDLDTETQTSKGNTDSLSLYYGFNPGGEILLPKKISKKAVESILNMAMNKKYKIDIYPIEQEYLWVQVLTYISNNLLLGD